MIDTKYRSQEPEIMDNFSLEGEELRAALDQIARINQFLGGNTVILHALKQLLKKTDRNGPIRIVDIGCGNGDMLRMLATYGQKNNLNFQLIGIDANDFTINYAKTQSVTYPNIEYVCVDIFSDDFTSLTYDIALCTLTLHHFTNEEILNIITTFNNNATIGVVVNDLHRSKIAYGLFEIICTVFKLNRMSRQDGLVSILRGFKKKDLEDFSREVQLQNYTINWKWAFRYQWIIAKT
jgi:2-polyprenyl-3-methyl-5-hydroxy-6-metoxy-1,4-benzoquinol methylase